MNMLCCFASLTVAFLSTISFLAYNDFNNAYQPYLPAVYQTNTAPMMLTSGNWTCLSYMQTYQNKVKKSLLTEDSQWWMDCNPKENCQTMMTWLETEIDSGNQMVQNRHIKYYHQKLVSESCLTTRGSNSSPYYANETKESHGEFSYKIVPSRCVGQFTFRNMLNGDYLIESTYNMVLLKRWMGMVGNMYNVKYMDPCYINLQYEQEPSMLDYRMHCVLDIQPMNMDRMTSYDLRENYQLVEFSKIL